MTTHESTQTRLAQLESKLTAADAAATHLAQECADRTFRIQQLEELLKAALADVDQYRMMGMNDEEYAHVLVVDNEAQTVLLFLGDAAFEDFTKDLKDNQLVGVRRLSRNHFPASGKMVKATIKIPRGWRKLCYHEKLKVGDRVFDSVTKPFKWLEIDESSAGMQSPHRVLIYIRRVSRRRRAA